MKARRNTFTTNSPEGHKVAESALGHPRRAKPVRCTSAYHPIAVDWLQLKLK
jgi:hypothetical protein